MAWWPAKDSSDSFEALATFIRTRVRDYAAYLDANDVEQQIVDIGELPHPKEEILRAACMLLGSGTLKIDNQERLFQDALLLANFQPGIGQYAVFPFGLDSRYIDLSGISAARLAKINPAGNGLYERLRPGVLAETKKIDDQLRRALFLGRQRAKPEGRHARSGV